MGYAKKLACAVAVLSVAPMAAAQSQAVVESGLIMSTAMPGESSGGDSVTTASLGLDYSEGKYGDTRKSSTSTVSLMLKHETGPLTFRANIPWVRATGTRAAGGDRGALTRQTESGLGDITVGAFYNAYNNSSGKYGVDVGAKVKLPTADDSKSLLTTGEADYSLQTDIYKSYGATTVFSTLGWTRKGDPDFVNFRNPWFGSIGVSYKFSASTAFGAAYDYRQKVTSNGDPVSEASLFMTHKLTRQVKLQAYLVGGFSDASPDVGGGAVISVAY